MQPIPSASSNAVAFALIVTMASVLLGCATTDFDRTYSYEPPKIDSNSVADSVVIDKPFDQAWVALLDQAASSFFSVRGFEKTTGLVRLGFGAADPKEFVDCGRWTAFRDGSVERETAYLDDRESETSFSGSVNIFMKRLDASRTQLSIRSRYSLRIFYKNSRPRNWNFKNGESATVRVASPSPGTIPTRTCAPTYAAEKEVLKWARSI